MLALAGGIRPDAGYSVRITRQVEWAASIAEDGAGRLGSLTVPNHLKKIMEAKNPEENIQIFPHDVISVPKAEMVYVIGEVKRSADSFSANTSPSPCSRCFPSPRGSTQPQTHGMPGSCG